MSRPHRLPEAASARQADPATGTGALALALLDDFAADTGLTSDRPPRRYLWTDAFAVCGFLGLHGRSGDGRFLDLAYALVEQVHHVLGRHRDDDPRVGWISGLSAEAGAAHPTAGGLRIGKPGPERPPGEPYDPQGEWDREGQYYHYLTRWMHALGRMWRVTGEERFHRWAVELAEAAHRGFVGGGRMYWKMSIDLSRPLVPSMGQHDPLDGRITVEALRATAPPSAGPDRTLAREARELDEICRGRSWITTDPLGLGGLLHDCLRLRQLREAGRALDAALEAQVLRDAARGLDLYAFAHRPDAPAAHRLAFRELGLAIGLHAAERMDTGAAAAESGDPPDSTTGSATLRPPPGLADEIEAFWSRPAHRRARAWTEHGDINRVMLAVALVPDGYLEL